MLMGTPYDRAVFEPSTSRAEMSRYIGGIEQSAITWEAKERAQIRAMVNIAGDENRRRR
jgi:hypothetical protein